MRCSDAKDNRERGREGLRVCVCVKGKFSQGRSVKEKERDEWVSGDYMWYVKSEEMYDKRGHWVEEAAHGES